MPVNVILYMRICAQNVCVNNNLLTASDKKYQYSGRNSLACDTFTPSFCGVKKSQFNELDFAVVEKFKAPIESKKFTTPEYLQEWADAELESIYSHDHEGRNIDVKYKRVEMKDEWYDKLTSDKDYTNTEKLLIFHGITKDMKPDDETLCPAYNKNVLDDTLNELKDRLKTDKKQAFDFGKMYRTNLCKYYAQMSEAGEDDTKWIIIPSKEHDPDNYKENLKKLKNMSTAHWCTKYKGADLYLSDGDFHIYVEKGQPKMAIRFKGDEIREVQSELNDFIIAREYLKILDEYIDENKFYTSAKVDDDIMQSRALIQKREKDAQPTVKPEENNGFWGFLTKLFK